MASFASFAGFGCCFSDEVSVEGVREELSHDRLLSVGYLQLSCI